MALLWELLPTLCYSIDKYTDINSTGMKLIKPLKNNIYISCHMHYILTNHYHINFTSLKDKAHLFSNIVITIN